METIENVVLCTDQKTWYVYLLCDPDTEVPFYVGKGTGQRARFHEKAINFPTETNEAKKQMIRQILSRGKQVLVKIVAEFTHEQEAYDREKALIAQYRSCLVNIRKGRNPSVARSSNSTKKQPIVIDGETYPTAAEAAKYLTISRPTFYQNIQPHIPEYKHGALKRIYYRQSDLDKYRGIRKIDSDRQ
jgi:excisionase family DNA binding protein